MTKKLDDSLSGKEIELLNAIWDEPRHSSAKKLAARFQLSPRTVETYLCRIRQRYCVNSTMAAVLLWHKEVYGDSGGEHDLNIQ